MKFSVLLSIYYKEDPAYFMRCMRSIWDEQSIRPNEIILVEDGPLPDTIHHVIKQWKEKLGDRLVLVKMSKNVGLGEALNHGLTQCQYEIVARMDTDDIALPERFEKQLQCFQKRQIDICSGWIGEFDYDESHIISYRSVPESHHEIAHFAKRRNPVNHPAVMYKKSKVIQAGGYQTMFGFEDYYLWVRMLLSSAEFYNLQETVVHMRAGEAQLARRRGFSYALQEMRFQRELLKLRFITPIEYLTNTSLRFLTRILPVSATKYIYRHLRRS